MIVYLSLSFKFKISKGHTDTPTGKFWLIMTTYMIICRTWVLKNVESESWGHNFLGFYMIWGICEFNFLLKFDYYVFRRMGWKEATEDHWIHTSKCFQNWESNRPTRTKIWPLHGGICRHSHFNGWTVCNSLWPVFFNTWIPLLFLPIIILSEI